MTYSRLSKSYNRMLSERRSQHSRRKPRRSDARKEVRGQKKKSHEWAGLRIRIRTRRPKSLRPFLRLLKETKTRRVGPRCWASAPHVLIICSSYISAASNERIWNTADADSLLGYRNTLAHTKIKETNCTLGGESSRGFRGRNTTQTHTFWDCQH